MFVLAKCCNYNEYENSLSFISCETRRIMTANIKNVDVKTGEQEKKQNNKISNARYEAEMARLQIKLVKIQEWIKHQGLRVAVIFEGRDAAGKDG